MNKTVKTVLITVLVMTVLCCCVGAWVVFGPEIIRNIQMRPAHQVGDNFMESIQTGNYEDALPLISDHIRQEIHSAEDLPVYFGILKPIDVFDRGSSITSTDRTKFSAAYHVTFTDQTEATIWLEIIKYENIWKITGVKIQDK